jgi:hypothetical protein
MITVVLLLLSVLIPVTNNSASKGLLFTQKQPTIKSGAIYNASKNNKQIFILAFRQLTDIF